MDPNVNLRAIRAEVASHLEHGDGDVNVLVEHFQELDKWLTDGGLRPKAWTTDDALGRVNTTVDEILELLQSMSARTPSAGAVARAAERRRLLWGN